MEQPPRFDLRDYWQEFVGLTATALLTVARRKVWDCCARTYHWLRSPGAGTRMAVAIESLSQTASRMEYRIEELSKSVSNVAANATIAYAHTRMLFELSSSPHFECAPNGQCIWTNVAAQRLFGLPAQQMLGYGWMAALHADDIETVKERWEETIRDWRPYKARYRVVANGQTFTVEATADVIRSPEGQPLAIWGRVDKLQAYKPN